MLNDIEIEKISFVMEPIGAIDKTASVEHTIMVIAASRMQNIENSQVKW